MKEEKKLLAVLDRVPKTPPPIWLMRQAGRYLPEYRELRARAKSFWAMCMNPAMASEVTLQPVRRFGFDAAILFSDILVVPHALGVSVSFEEGVGPLLAPITSAAGLVEDEKRWSVALAPAYEALERVRGQLAEGTALLGFAGAPWTLATYLAAGRGGDEQKAAKLWAYRDPAGFGRLLDILAACVSHHLARQIEAGADAVQIFDSWASGLPDSAFDSWVMAPTRKIVSQLRTIHPKAKVIGFPRAATLEQYRRYAVETGVDAISLDTAAPMAWAAKALGERVALQGNLDPMALVAGGPALQAAAQSVLTAMRNAPFIFNLGHGILPETPLSHVDELLKLVRGGA